MSAINHRRTISHISPGLVLGSTSTYLTTVSTHVSIDGKIGTPLTAQSNIATPTTDARTGLAFPALTDNQATVLVFGVTLAGAIAMVQGGIVDTQVGVTTTAGAFNLAPQFPALPDDFCPLGYALVRTAPSASNFTAGTSSWTATGITTSQIVQVDGNLPDRPQTS